METYQVEVEENKVFISLFIDDEYEESFVTTKKDLYMMLKEKHHINNITKKVFFDE